MCYFFTTITSPTSGATAPSSPLPQDTGGGTSASDHSNPTTPISTSQISPTVNLTDEYTHALQTSSYNEIWTVIHEPQSPSSHTLSQVLHPDRDSIQQALQRARPNKLTRLVSTYFDNSEHTSHLCLHLHHSIIEARALYAPIHDLIELLPTPFSQPQLDWAFDTLTEFQLHDNPFPSSHNFHDMRRGFSQLKQQLDGRLRKARKKVRFVRRTTNCSAICLIGTTVGVALSAVLIATHALAALVVAPFLGFLPTDFSKKQVAHIAQLDAAAKGTYVLNNDLDTIDRLVSCLHNAVESDKLLIGLGLQRGRDRYSIQEVVKQLRKNHPNFLHRLKDLEEHVCLCFATVNKARSLLLQELHLHQTA
ncbi:transmembrane protein, putative (DUF677) [Tasmannia lanceolata]|uniref:transmembrane protein, putative (DUF677) n=1 Tax=Tasmannia lanceolata TaxID=3420 RepID=UPI00406445E2